MKKIIDFLWIYYYSLILLITTTLIPLLVESSLTVSPNSHQKSVLQKTVKAILDFKRLPKPGEVIRPLSKTGNAASKYMRQLFRQYQGKNGAKLSSAEGNIVRSISPSLGIFKQKYALTFNLHTIKPTEQIIRAEIHYNLRTRTSKRNYWKKRRINEIRCIVQTSTGEPVELHKIETTPSWLSFDAQNFVSRILDSQMFYDFESLGPDNRFMGQRFAVKFLKVRKNGRIRSMNPETVLRHHTPFLLVRSNDPMLINKEEVMSSIYDMTPAKNENQNQEISENRVKSNDVTIKEIYDTGLPDHLRNQPTVVLLGGEERGQGGHMNSHCVKRDLKVEFADIGWAQWIIAPKSFEAHYCAGTCPFPLTPETNPSNHATIQSVIHAIGLHPYVPAVCCAPDKMDSLTLLYFDEDDNVVLKNYPRMTVSSCGCL